MPPVRWREVAACFLLIGGCDSGCAAVSVDHDHAITFGYMMMGPFAAWALVRDEELPGAWSGLLFVTLTTVIPLCVYFWTRAAPRGALLWAALCWLWWGFAFTIAVPI